jgi:hypothetical protein
MPIVDFCCRGVAGRGDKLKTYGRLLYFEYRVIDYIILYDSSVLHD